MFENISLLDILANAGIILILNFLFSIVQRWINRKSVHIERRKLKAETMQEEVDTISTVVEKYNKLSKEHMNTSALLASLTLQTQENQREICDLKERLTIISNENELLKEKNERVDIKIKKLISENNHLHREVGKQLGLITDFEDYCEELSKGIRILLKQLDDIPLVPNWTPRFSEDIDKCNNE